MCPAGKAMWLSSRDVMVGDTPAYQFCGYLNHCRVCPSKAQCLCKPDQPSARSVVFRYKLGGYKKPDALQLMKDRIDSPAGKRIYSKRLAITEPPFGHVQETELTRFTL
ncbi:transposase [Endozoicomonas sp. 8E]|uniref:transposase n=1 Tax=Endozoicomonas sp. 8E TaxID=3035692 RepID=UPI00293939C3|nr:transposase [Endozoicomonas sp. 8E]WOG30423.1 transposase [Endozoicomonas sp. 8E]